MSELGNITIKISLVLAQRQFLSRARGVYREKVELYDGAIHETSKKICDHRVMYVHFPMSFRLFFYRRIFT